MFKITEYVNPSSIWSTAKDYENKGEILGLVRGYNIEVLDKNGEAHWLSCSYIDSNPEEYFNDEFHKWYYEEHQWTPTGRISFRGYGREYYDPEERDTFVEIIENI